MEGKPARVLKCLWQAWYPLLLYEAVTGAVVFTAGRLEMVSGVNLPEGQELLLTAVVAAIMAAPLLLLYRKTTNPFPAPGHRRKKAAGLVILLGISACLLFNYLFMLADFTSPSYRQAEAILYAPGRMIQFAAIGVLAPLAEELVFRGFGFWRMRKLCTFAQAAFFSSLCFGLFHGNIVQGVYGFCLGFILALVFEVYHKLWAPVLLHITANITSLLLTWLDVGWLPAPAAVLLSGSLLLIGINMIREDGKT